MVKNIWSLVVLGSFASMHADFVSSSDASQGLAQTAASAVELKRIENRLQSDNRNKVAIPFIPEGLQEKPIVVVTTSYNNKDWYVRNLDSIRTQKYSNYRVIYINDVSSDGTGDLVAAYIKKYGLEDRITLINNPKRLLALANHHHAICSCKDEEIVVICNGDDWFAHDQVLAYVNSLYQDPNVWLTYGQYQVFSSGARGHCGPMPDDIIKNNAFRKHQDTPSHLRTFYAGLYKQIKVEDLYYEGDFLKMTEDMAMMMPMIEMARDGHFRFVPQALLIYNDANVINDHKVSMHLQRAMDKYIRSKKPYDKIDSPFKGN